MWNGRRLVTLGFAAACVLALAVPAVFADDVDLQANARLTISGAANDFGFSSAPAGDVNGDGRPDFIVSASSQSVNGRNASGEAWVVFGLPGRTTFNITALGADGFRIIGPAANAHAGEGVAGVGDVNGDGKDDVLVAAPFANANKGIVYIVFGRADTTDVDLATFDGTQSGGYRILGGQGASGERLGDVADANLGDVNGDHRPDQLIAAPNYNNGAAITGGADVVYSHATTADIDLSTPGSWGYLIKGAEQSDVAGSSLAAAGDVNGDGIPDALIGAYQHGINQARLQNGAAYVVFGKPTPPAAPIALGTLATDANGIDIEGAASSDQFGYFVSGAGDTNGDGKADVAVAALFTDHNGRADSGTIYVVRGRAASGTIDLATATGYGYAIDGAAAGSRLQRVDASTDFNADGRADLLFTDTTAVAGKFPVWLVPGQSGDISEDLASPPAGTRRLLTSGALAAHPSADADGDGRPDIVVSTNGALYVYTGAATGPTSTPTLTPTPAPVATTQPPPQPTPTPAPTATPAPKKLNAAKIVNLPHNEHCVAGRRLHFKLKLPKDQTIVSATVTVNGKRATVVKGAKLKTTVTLRGLPKQGIYTIAVTLKPKTGRSAKTSRRYIACKT
jgi:hypothetical protein